MLLRPKEGRNSYETFKYLSNLPIFSSILFKVSIKLLSHSTQY